MRSRAFLSFVLSLSFWLCQGCGNAFTNSDPASSDGGTAPTPTPVVESANIRIIQDTTLSGYGLQKIRVKEDNLRASYFSFFAAQAAFTGARPTLVIPKPFDGIDWSQETVDQKWAARPNAATGYTHADSDSLGYTTGDIDYRLAADATLLSEAQFYLDRGLNVVFVFSRFYAGGTINDQVSDLSVALRYLKTHARVVAAKIGIQAEGWGALGATHAIGKSSVAIRSAVLISPLYDLSSFSLQYAITLDDMVTDGDITPTQKLLYDDYFAPFGRRIYPETGGPIGQLGVDYSAWDQDNATTYLKIVTGHVLVLADETNTRIPFTAMKAVVTAAAPATTVTGLWFSHLTPVDYTGGPLDVTDTTDGMPASIVNLMTKLEILAELGDGVTPVSIPYDSVEFADYMAYMWGEADRGQNIDGLLRPLINLSASHISLSDTNGAALNQTGAAAVATALNTSWPAQVAPAPSTGVFTSTNVQQWLIDNNLPLP